MQIHLSPRHLRLTAAIHSYVAGKIEHLEDQADDIVAAHIVLLHDETKNKKHTVKVHLAVPGPDIHAEDSEQDLYVAIDKVVDKLHQLLRKRKTKSRLNKRHKLQLSRERKKLGR
ncbi:MAG: ribosome-associated translation inhibitor RaiA [Chthoniobacterales bacterium]